MFFLCLPLALSTIAHCFQLFRAQWVTHALLILSSRTFNLVPVFCYYKQVPLIDISSWWILSSTMVLLFIIQNIATYISRMLSKWNPVKLSSENLRESAAMTWPQWKVRWRDMVRSSVSPTQLWHLDPSAPHSCSHQVNVLSSVCTIYSSEKTVGPSLLATSHILTMSPTKRRVLKSWRTDSSHLRCQAVTGFPTGFQFITLPGNPGLRVKIQTQTAWTQLSDVTCYGVTLCKPVSLSFS